MDWDWWNPSRLPLSMIFTVALYFPWSNTMMLKMVFNLNFMPKICNVSALTLALYGYRDVTQLEYV